MASPITRYPLDPTGANPNNKVIDEEHNTANRNIRIICPNYGGFFTRGMVLKEKSTQRVLTPGVDYIPAELYATASQLYGAEICSIILIKNKTFQPPFQFTYQALGGPYSYSNQSIIQMIEGLNLDDRPVKWGDIIGKPTAFDPAPHLHDIGDIYGFEYLVDACEAIRRAILMGDVASHDEIYRYIDAAYNDLKALIDANGDALTAHINNFGNPHKVTADQVDTYVKAVIDQKDLKVYNDLLALLNAEKITPLAIAPGTTLNRATHLNKVLFVQGPGTVTFAAGWQPGDMCFIATANGSVTIAGSGVTLAKPLDQNLTIHQSGAMAGVFFNALNQAFVTGYLQYV